MTALILFGQNKNELIISVETKLIHYLKYAFYMKLLEKLFSVGIFIYFTSSSLVRMELNIFLTLCSKFKLFLFPLFGSVCR